MRTLALYVMIAGAALGAAPPHAGAVTRPRHAPCTAPRFRTDGVPPAVEHQHARLVVRCVFWHVAPHQIAKAHQIAERESRFDDEARNTYSGAAGLFQHLPRYWRSRAATLPLRWFPHRARIGPFDARANAWAAAIMVRRGGWGPWGG